MRNRIVQTLVLAIVTLLTVAVPRVALAQAEPLHGTVISKAEKPLEEVQVVLRSPGSTDAIMEHITDEEGVFIIPMDSLRPGYEIHLHKDGYQDVVQPISPQQLVVPKIRVIMLRTRSTPTAESTPPKQQARDPETVWNSGPADSRERAIRLYNDAVEKFEEDAKDKDAARAEAERMFREAASIDPTFPDPQRILVRIAIKHRNWAEASRYAEALIRIDPTDEEAVNNLYISLVITRHFKRVGEAAKRLISIDPDKISSVESHAAEFYRNNIYQMARALYQALTEVAPDMPNAYLNLGTCSAALGDVEATRAAYENFLRLADEDNPDVETVRQELAKLDKPEEPE